MVEINKKTVSVVYSREEIAKEVKRIGEEITRDYQGKRPLLIGVLKGSYVFMADLAREIDLPCKIDFIEAKSYGTGTVSSGFVRVSRDIETVIEGKDVIIVEDILETGNTLKSICEELLSRKPASLKICVFLDKKVNRKINIEADYVCYEIDDVFAVGYGLDYAEKYRNLPYLGALN